MQSELLLDSVSLGDLCHTKSSLRLPLNLVTVNSITDDETTSNNKLMQPLDSKADNKKDDEEAPINTTLTSLVVVDNNIALATPSCTGSMDSLSSSSGSLDRPVSFTTFGKKPLDLMKTSSSDIRNNEKCDQIICKESDIIKPSLIFIEEGDNDILGFTTATTTANTLINIDTNNHDHDKTKRQSDSTDEDSGIENVMRFAK